MAIEWFRSKKDNDDFVKYHALASMKSLYAKASNKYVLN